MKIDIGVINLDTGSKLAFTKNVRNIEEARNLLSKLIYEFIEMNAMPTYVLIDGEQRMKKIGEDDYEIEL